MTNLYFRVYATQDVIGVQLGGALKNPLAIGAGIIEGTGMGINTMAAYLTRSSLELQALCKAMGGEPQTISGLSGVGGTSSFVGLVPALQTLIVMQRNACSFRLDADRVWRFIKKPHIGYSSQQVCEHRLVLVTSLVVDCVMTF